ncbi:MAG: AarF/UbiB family protein [Actinomycetota bacterium]
MSIRDDLPRTVRRTVQLSALPVGSIADRLAGLSRRVGGADADTVQADLRQRAADRMRSVLGDAKGGALKAGQLLSTVDALFPADPDATWARALAALPADNPALPFALVEPVLAAELGDRWRRRFSTFGERAVAAASIGQVHRATLPDGRAVAVKVQYPDVAEALQVDLAIVSVMTRLASTVAPGMALPPLVAEMRERLVEELQGQHDVLVSELAQTESDASSSSSAAQRAAARTGCLLLRPGGRRAQRSAAAGRGQRSWDECAGRTVRALPAG